MLNLFKFLIAYALVASGYHGRNEVGVLSFPFAGFHRSARYKDGGNVEAHGGHKHAGSYFVAIADAHKGVGFVGVDHVFNAVGNEVAAGQTVEHAVVAHGDAVVNGDGVELGSEASELLDFGFYDLSGFVQVSMSRYELGERVGDGNDGLAKLFAFHAGCYPEGAGAGH